MSSRKIGRVVVATSSEEKLYFPADGITKGDVIDYYAEIAPLMFPLLEGRAITMHRFPEGIEDEGFIQQAAADHFPDWVGRENLPKVSGGDVEHVVCRNRATIVYLANQGCITPHAWLSRVDRPDRPDRLIFDLDPSGDDFAPVRRAAMAIREVIEELGLRAFAMTTGSRGLHVVVPIRREFDFDTVRGFARSIAETLADEHPDELTLEQRKDKRSGRIFLDVGRNAYGQTAVAPYAVRARPGAPIATPVDWHEVADARLTPRRYTIKNIRRRLARKEDPWRDLKPSARSLRKALSQLA